MRPATGARSSVNSRFEFRLSHRSLRGGDLGLGRALGLHALLVDLLGDGLLADQALRAVEIGHREVERGLGARQIGARLLERGLERPLVDGEQQIALLHQLAVLEMDGLEIAGNARAHFDGIDRDEAADIFVLVGDRALHRLGHGDRRRGRRGGLLRGLAAGGERQRKHEPRADARGGNELHRAIPVDSRPVHTRSELFRHTAALLPASRSKPFNQVRPRNKLTSAA